VEHGVEIGYMYTQILVEIEDKPHLKIRLRGTQPHLVLSAIFPGLFGLLRSVNTEYLNDGSGLPSKSDHIWSCCPPSLKKDNRIFGWTMGD
jgi:hypothetical protein